MEPPAAALVKLFVMLAEARKCWKLAGPNKLLIDQRKSARAYLAGCTSLSSSIKEKLQGRAKL